MKKIWFLALVNTFVVGTASTTFAASNPFSDVPADHWAYDSVAKLVSNGVISGYNDGSYYGNNVMTRYEMAQIIAKAMSNQDKLNSVQKAKLDKLAAEFSDELASLGVRVAALEANTDPITLTGIVRYSASREIDEQNAKDSSSNTGELRLMPHITINDNWSVDSRVRAKFNMQNNTSNALSVDRIFATAKVNDFTFKFGKMPEYFYSNHGLTHDITFSGIEASYAKNNWNLMLSGGRMTDIQSNSKAAADYFAAEAYYAKDKVNAGVSFANMSGIEGNTRLKAGDDKLNVLGLGAGYKFDSKWAVQADYAQALTDLTNDSDKKSYNAQVSYGTFKKKVPGTFEVYAAYRKLNKKDGINVAATYDTSTANNAFKGWVFGTQVGLANNIFTKLEYATGNDYNSNDKGCNILYGKVEFIF